MITFREFLLVCEKVSTTPPHAVPGTFVRHSDGSQSYTLNQEPVKSTKGSAKKVTQALEKQGGTGGKAIEKMLKKRVKKVKKIKEDIEARRQQFKQQRSNQILTQRQSVADYHTSKRKASEREELKKEIKRELQTEQTPAMEPNLYNQQVARQSATWKGRQIRQSHGEMQSRAQSEVAAKQKRLKAIMSR
jgi:hypothetical protein